MPKKQTSKINHVVRIRRLEIKQWGRKTWYLTIVVALCIAGIPRINKDVSAVECPDVRIVFARGSGGERWNTDDYLDFKQTIESKLATTSLSYEFIDLDYPAVGVGIDNMNTLATTIKAFFGKGEAYEFGDSVRVGVDNLHGLVNGRSCPGTKYVLGGYSQGAMVVSRGLKELRADRVIYAATFGDPKLYLPEGAGVMPAACKGENLSDYRMYVPDCQAYKGLLGAYIPYEPSSLVGKVGTWCNRRDIFCSSHLSMTDHVSYVEENLYEDASRVIFDKICQSFGIENTVSSPHDTAILIDSTGSMNDMIDGYKVEARRLAKKTLDSGGRVALYDYRDYQEGYRAKQHCSFETCTIESFEVGLTEIQADEGGDTPESLLASSLQVMQELNWRAGATKSIVVLTDAGYHDPDYDIGGTTKLDVVRLSKQIDPVNFYIVTTPENVDTYAGLASETGGQVVTTVDDLAGLTDYIMERYDSLPRVEESDASESPTITIDEVSYDDSGATVKFTVSGGDRALVILNDYVLGAVEVSDGIGVVTVSELDLTVQNVLTLMPLGDDTRGEGAEINLNIGDIAGLDENIKTGEVVVKPNINMPKAPNTGKAKF